MTAATTTGASRRFARPAAAGAVSVVSIAMVVIGVALHAADGGSAEWWTLAANVSHAFLLTGTGWWLARSPEGRRVGWLLLGAGAAASLSILVHAGAAYASGAGWPGATFLAWLALWLWPLFVVPLFTVLPAIFPNGWAPSRAWRWVPWLGVAATVLMAVASAVEPAPLPTGDQPGAPNPLAIPAGPTVMTIAVGFVAASAIAAVASLIARWLRAAALERQQLKVLAYGIGLAVMIELIGGMLPPAVAQVGYFLVPFLLIGGIGLAVQRYRLYDIDPLIRSTVVFVAITAVIFAVYLAAVWLMGAAVGSTAGVALVASAAIAGIADPLRRRAQRAVGRLLYGQREEPLEALAELRQQLRAVSDPFDVPATTATVIAEALRTPFVAIDVLAHGALTEVARVGRASGQLALVLPLEWRGEQVGTLRVGPRSPGEAYSRTDRTLLEELAHAVGAALHALRLGADLRDARERAAHAIADERLRLRHDLHDGLGPLLSGIGLAVDGVRRSLDGEPRIEAELGVIAAEVRGAATAVRRIIDALPPAAVVDAGFSAAVADHVDRCATLPGAPRLVCDLTGAQTARIRPAVADAAYFVVLEALSNVLRHARAEACTITMRTTQGELAVEVADDGIGIGASYRPGVGTSSMRRRATELGGRFTVAAGEPRGTRVRAEFPLEAPA